MSALVAGTLTERRPARPMSSEAAGAVAGHEKTAGNGKERMADIWVLCQSPTRHHESSLVRVDTISWMRATPEQLSGGAMGSQETVVLAQRATEHGTFLPEDFQLALLAQIGEARERAQNSGEDQVLRAELDEAGAWGWMVAHAREMWPG